MQEKMAAFTEENRSEEYRWFAAFCPDFPPLTDYIEEDSSNE